jgi:hypothetical protein
MQTRDERDRLNMWNLGHVGASRGPEMRGLRPARSPTLQQYLPAILDKFTVRMP